MDLWSLLVKVFALWRVVLPAMFLGCLFGNWIQETRFWEYLSRRLAPVMQFAGLPANCSLYEFFANHLPLSMTFFGPKNGIRLASVHLITRLVFITLIVVWILIEN